MLKNYRELKVWQKSYDLNYVNKDNLKILKGGTAEIERMVKALIKSLENKPLNPGTLESWNPLLQ